MATTSNLAEMQTEIARATQLARQVRRPRGVHDVSIEPDEDPDGHPMLVISIDVDDDPDPSDERLDELIDYEDEVAKKISDGGVAGWPLVRLVPRV